MSEAEHIAALARKMLAKGDLINEREIVIQSGVFFRARVVITLDQIPTEQVMEAVNEYALGETR